MATKSKRIKGKILQEALTPADVPDKKKGDVFYKLAGSHRYHSLQIWREDKDGAPTIVYGMTVPQISAILSGVEKPQAVKVDDAVKEDSVIGERQVFGEQIRVQERLAELTDENRRLREDKNLQLQIFNRLTHILPGGLRAIQRAIKEANSPNFYPDDLPPEKAKSIKAILYPANGSQKWRKGR